MIECDRVRARMSAQLDGELSVEETGEVQQHVQACASCRHEWETLTEIDNRLARAFVVEEVDRKCAEVLNRRVSVNQASRNENSASSWRLIAVGLFAVAATLLIATLPFFAEKDTSQNTIPSLNLVAQLTRATGPVQFLPAGETDWSEVAPEARKSFAAGSRLKTSTGVLCEIETTSKGVLRLNESAEIVFVEANRVELVAGKLWCLTPASTSIEVVMPEPSQQATLPLTVACPASTEFQCAAGERSVSCDSLSKNNSTATMTMGAVTCSVAPGETVSIDREQKVDRKLSVDAASKIWQLPLLAIGVEVDQELVLLLDRILAPIGMSKARNMNEDQLRMLGPAGALPLLAYAVR